MPKNEFKCQNNDVHKNVNVNWNKNINICYRYGLTTSCSGKFYGRFWRRYRSVVRLENIREEYREEWTKTNKITKNKINDER